jgi:hypothetical protein
MEAVVAINTLRGIARPVLATAGNQETFPVPFTFRLVLERLESSLGTLEVLVKDNALRHDHSIGLICRNILSDAIATGYLVKLSTSDENLYENLYALYHADLKRTDSIIKLFRDGGVLTTEEATRYSEKYAIPNSMYKVIRDYQEEHKPKAFPKNTEVIRQLLETKKDDPWSIELQRSFDIWTYYSKYEHLGWYAYELTRNLDPRKAAARFLSVLRLSALLQSSCFEVLSKKQAYGESFEVYRKLFAATNQPLTANV